MRFGLLLSLLPDEILPLLLGVGILAMLLGLLAPKTLLAFVGLFVLFSLLSPFIEDLIGGLSLWVQVLILGFFGLAILRGVFGLLLGARAGDTLVAHLAYDLLRLPFRLVRGAFRLAFWPFREPRL